MTPARILTAFVAVGVLAGSLSLTVVRLFSVGTRTAVLLTSFVPFAVIGYLVVALLALLFLRGVRGLTPVLLSVSLLGLVLHGIWLAPSYAGQHSAGSPDLVVMELNEQLGGADPADAARVVEQQDPDVLVLTETRPASIAGLAAHGVGGGRGRWRYQAGDPATGTVILSSHRLTGQRPVPLAFGTAWTVRVHAGQPFTLIAGHPAQAVIAFGLWRQDFETLHEVAVRTQGPRMVVGDLNATTDHVPLRGLLATGLADAAQQADSGWQPTWPSRGSTHAFGLPVPIGLFAIDHVLLSDDFSAVDTRTYPVRRTDHLALVVAVRRVG